MSNYETFDIARSRRTGAIRVRRDDGVWVPIHKPDQYMETGALRFFEDHDVDEWCEIIGRIDLPAPPPPMPKVGEELTQEQMRAYARKGMVVKDEDGDIFVCRDDSQFFTWATRPSGIEGMLWFPDTILNPILIHLPEKEN